MISKLDIIGKVAVIPEQIKAYERSVKQLKHYEIQLLPDFMEDPARKKLEHFKTVTESFLVPDVVHTPLISDTLLGEPTLEYLLNDDIYEAIKETFNLAEMLAHYYNKKMKVVVHFTSIYEIWKACTIAYDAMCERIKTILEGAPNTIMCIENYVPYVLKEKKPTGKAKHPQYYVLSKGGYLYDNIYLAEDLRRQYPELADQIGITIDTCHAMLAQRFEVMTCTAGISTTPTVRDWFKRAGDLCKVIHLNNCIGDGLRKGTHSTSFYESDRLLLSYILDAIKKYAPSATITLELIEDDYNKDPVKNKEELVEFINEIEQEEEVI